MQLLTFTIADRRYGIDSSRIIEVLPRVPLRPLPQMPAAVRGAFRYRGGYLAVVDLGLLLVGQPCRESLGTRTVVVAVHGTVPGQESRLAVVAEDVVGMVEVASPPPLGAAEGPAAAASTFLGPLLPIADHDDRVDLQLILVDHLLPSEHLAAIRTMTGMGHAPASLPPSLSDPGS